MVCYGKVVELKCYQKIVKPQHYMKKFRGVGISDDILHELIADNVKLIRIVYLGNNTEVYMTTVKKFVCSEKIHVYDGIDKQFFVSLHDMLRVK